MNYARKLRKGIGVALLVLSVLRASGAVAQDSPDLVQRVLPNPNPEVALNWAALPDDRVWGSTAGIDIDPTDGHVWAYDRCGGLGLAGGCAANPTVDPILKYDRNTGELLAAFGAGLFVLPYGLHVADDGNVWVTDAQGNGEIGHQVFKFSPEGEVLMTLGVAGDPGSDPEGLHLNAPTDVITWGPTGDIFVSDGLGGENPDPPPGQTGRILKYDRDGNFITQWGELGFRPGQFRTPHAMEFDSQGRLFVADRGNNRIQIFDQEGELLDIYYQFSRVSGLYITNNDTLYAIDSESTETNHYGWLNGVRIGPAGEDRVAGFIPPYIPEEGRTLQGLAGDGVAVDADGNVFVAEGPASRPFVGGGITKFRTVSISQYVTFSIITIPSGATATLERPASGEFPIERTTRSQQPGSSSGSATIRNISRVVWNYRITLSGYKEYSGRLNLNRDSGDLECTLIELEADGESSCSQLRE